MSTPQDSTAPAEVTTSDPAVVGGKTNVVRFSERVKTWIAALSPSGADKYDTGWVDITPADGFTSVGAQVRRIGSVVHLRGRLDGAVSTGSQNHIGTVPAGFTPAGGADNAVGTVGVAAFSNNTHWATVAASGEIRVIPTASGNYAMRLKGLSGYTVD